jgi:P27 family predicted phage terminase small subunit
MRGRKPKSPTVRLYEGNAGKRSLHADTEPQPEIKEPPCPDWLSADAKAKWVELAPELLRMGLLTVLDGAAFACYCQSWAEYHLATRALAKEGRTYKLKNGCRATHPMVNQQKSALKSLRDFAALFGLEPSSRTRLKVVRQPEDADPAEQFFNDGKGKAKGQ